LKFGHLGAGVLDGKDEDMPDWRIANYGIEQLGRKHDKPFFIAVGFLKPHSPLVVPRKYFDLHPLADIELPPYLQGDLDDIPAPGKKRAIAGGNHEAIVKAGKWKEMVQAYLACVSFVDAQVGRVLEALEKSPDRDNTIVVFLGDHGWALGEKDHWAKLALWEEEARAPLIWKVPGMTPTGSVCARTVDFMGIYPTVMELCGLPIPAHVEGASYLKLLHDPAAPWDRPGITTNGPNEHAARSEGWRYIRYATGEEELYDEGKDPYEWTNVAAKPEHADLKKQLGAAMPARSKAPAGTFSGDGEEEDAAVNRGARVRKPAPTPVATKP
jgi:arylsulfatase A-like enzyme